MRATHLVFLNILYSDAYHTTGCYNLRCPGFVQTSRSIVLGGAISPVSVLGDRQYEFTVRVWKVSFHYIYTIKAKSLIGFCHWFYTNITTYAIVEYFGKK